jgi:hypothetical protein
LLEPEVSSDGAPTSDLAQPETKSSRPAIFKWRQTESGLIVCAVRWYLRYPLSLRDVEELLGSAVSLSITRRFGAIRKGQVRWVPGDNLLRQIQFINRLFGLAT